MTRSVLSPVIALTSLLTLAGCSAISSQPPAVSAGLPQQIELTEVPFFPQEEYQCGPAALATVMGHYGEDLTPALLAPQVYLPAREGSLQPELKAAARRAGMVPYPLRPQLDALLKEVAAGNPVLVLQNLGLGLIPQWHYAVVVGFDQAEQQLILRSGTDKRRQVDMATFMNTWRRSDNWGLVITPVDRIPVTADADRWLQASYELAGVAMADAALALDTAVDHWPTRSSLWLAAGNVHYSLKNYPGAARQFRKGLRLHPEEGALWNNYAYTLSEMGCQAAAVSSARCAVRMAPESAEFQSSLTELMGTLPATAAEQQCPTIRCKTN